VKTILKERSLTPAIRAFIEDLVQRWEPLRCEVLAQRDARRKVLSSGDVSFLEETAHVRQGRWKVADLPAELMERRVELIGGVTRPELVDGMNVGAKSYIADLWNSTSGETWNILRAHRNLERAAALDLAYLPGNGGRIRINPGTSTRLMIAPRPLYVLEPAYLIKGEPIAATFLDLALVLHNCTGPLTARQGGVYLYLRNIHGHQEARLWGKLLDMAEEHLGLPRGTFRVTIMVDTINGALEAEEILFELSHHAAGLSMDPQGYASDHIALFHGGDRPVLPDREQVGLAAPLFRSLSWHLIGIAHRRGCHAIGAPAFVLPAKEDERVKEDYLEMLSDVERQAIDGHDGTIVVHPGTVNAAMMEFNKNMPRAHQLDHQRKDDITPADLIRRPEGTISVDSLLGAVRTCLRMLVQGSDGRGWVVQGGRLHDRSSLRLAMRLLWHWCHSEQGVISATGLVIGPELLRYLVRKESEKMYGQADDRTKALAKRAVNDLLERLLSDALPIEPMH
jgi:malate synthase